MSTALYALLDSIIDYAGLFPPAKLNMAEALPEYIKHRRGSERWMVSRFVCPVSRLVEFSDVLDTLELQSNDTPIPISLLGSRIENAESNLADEWDAIQAFVDDVGSTCVIEAYEVRKPDHLKLGSVTKALSRYKALDVFLELPWSESLVEDLHFITEHDWMGAKARTGGIDPDDFPSPRDLSTFMHECLSLDLRFKLTAGMHHPIRHRDQIIGAHQHGFLNVATAAALAEEYDFTREQMESVLANENPTSFIFGPDTMFYEDLEIDAAAIEDMRTLFVSYGSCSVNDPLLGLAKLGLIEVARS